VGDDVHFKLHALGEGTSTAADSDSVHLRIRMGWYGDGIGELFSTDGSFLTKDLRTGAFKPTFQRLHEGDSMSVIAPVDAWPWKAIFHGTDQLPPDTGVVQMEIMLLALRTPAIIKAEREHLRRDDPVGYERRLINAYMTIQQVDFTRWGTSAIHYAITGIPSDTNKVVAGDRVTITYQGVRLEDGRVFDDTKRNGEAFTFIYGERDQVMHGLEIAVLLLREGQQGRFIFPSENAFGAKGIPGVLDPYMPVEYTVRLEKLQRSGPR
jgi:hypothetical protein